MKKFYFVRIIKSYISIILIFILGFFCYNGLNGQASISGSVWHDLNGNGQQGGEPYINGFTVELYNVSNVLQAVSVTFGSGSYSFNSLADGTYYVKFIIIAPNIITASGFGTDTTNCDVTGANGPGTTDTIVLSANDNLGNIDAGYYNYLNIGDFVWEDRNGNGLQDPYEPGIENVTVNLIRASDNTIVGSALTDAEGLYYFDDSDEVGPGDYLLSFVVPSGYAIINKDTGADSIDNDVAPGSGLTEVFTLESGSESHNWDAGMFRPPVIGDLCWRDQNLNGLQDAVEVLSPNIEVSLLRKSDDQEVGYTITDGNGHYQFGPDPDIYPGEYYIRFGITNSLHLTVPDAGNDLIDSDPDPVSGETPSFMLESSEYDFSIDAGFYVEPPDSCDSPTVGDCEEAEILCNLADLNGFCTSMVQAWQQTTIPGCGSGYAFHNPSWFSFVAGAEDVYLIIHASNCVSGGGNIGIQWGIYDDCDLQGPVILQCPCVDPGDIDVFLNNLTVGQAYYFFIDGCSGTMCTYWIEFIYGGGLPDVLGPDNVVCNEFQNCENICTGADVTFILQDVYNATHYIWNIDGNIIKTTYPELTTSFDGAGNYNICVNGYNACNEGNEFCFNVSVNPRPSVNISSTPASGNNINDGTATANPEGGIAPYTYLWSNGQTTQTITGLAPGTYSVTVTDANQCTDLGYIIINSEGCGALSLNIFTIDESCSGYCNGALAITGINNGTSPFTYSWSNGSNTPLINNLCSGTYTVTVTDAESCTVTDTVIIVPEVEIIITVDTIVNITSNGYGAIILSVNEGDYSYSWTGPENFTSDDFIILNLKLAGCYTLVITENESGCTKDSTICISDLTGTKNLSGDAKVIIYPNPANDYLVVDFSATEYGEANIWISDLSGRKIISAKKSATDNKLHLNTGYINAGLYFMRIEMKDNAFYRKVEIVR